MSTTSSPAASQTEPPPPKLIHHLDLSTRSSISYGPSPSPSYARRASALSFPASPSCPHDSILHNPSHLLHGHLRNPLRCHRRAPRHRIHAGSLHRGCQTHRFPPGSGQRAVHHGGALVRVHVHAWRHWDRAVGSDARQKSV
ncbi:putative oligosaccharyltransferase complex subunit cg9662 [Phtheirospermum japonicum]|uniref:Putative oligosaccharyltransferase complex subunit cg9662 n=1 Tax=Phtheirospermum japonicum TaxID=374723 RepID=A0A830D9I9_9LAMI|nr:putative oligosaccharyltransferase complex subunit cg9662 [Phtheirospermum japonicum]